MYLYVSISYGTHKQCVSNLIHITYMTDAKMLKQSH